MMGIPNIGEPYMRRAISRLRLWRMEERGKHHKKDGKILEKIVVKVKIKIGTQKYQDVLKNDMQNKN